MWLQRKKNMVSTPSDKKKQLVQDLKDWEKDGENEEDGEEESETFD